MIVRSLSLWLGKFSRLAAHLRRPMSIPVEDISTPLPTLIDDPSSFVPSPDPPNIAAFIHTVKLRAQNGMMASVLYKPHSAPTFTDISCVKSAAELIAFRAGKKRILDDWLATAPYVCAASELTADSMPHLTRRHIRLQIGSELLMRTLCWSCIALPVSTQKILLKICAFAPTPAWD